MPDDQNNYDVVFLSLFNLLWRSLDARDSNTRGQTPAIKKLQLIVAEVAEEKLTFGLEINLKTIKIIWLRDGEGAEASCVRRISQLPVWLLRGKAGKKKSRL